MICLNCFYPQYCPCSTCRDRLPDGISPWVWPEENSDMVQCANCGGWWGIGEEWEILEDRLSDPAYYATMNYAEEEEK